MGGGCRTCPVSTSSLSKVLKSRAEVSYQITLLPPGRSLQQPAMSRERGWELQPAIPHLLFLMASFNCLECCSHQLMWQQQRAGEAEGSRQGEVLGCSSRDIGCGGLFSCMIKEGLTALVAALRPIYRMEATSDTKSTGSPHCFRSLGYM